MRTFLAVNMPDNSSQYYPFHDFANLQMVRQGAHPIKDHDAVIAFNDTNFWTTGSRFNRKKCILSPDKNKMVMMTGHEPSSSSQSTYIGNRFNIYGDTRDLSNVFSPTFSFGGLPRAAACSNELFAIGGTGPNLIVVDWATFSLPSMNLTGLGTIWDLSFSDDGQYLYVAHSSAPYLRRYDVSDLMTYQDLDPALITGTQSGYGFKACKWTPHGILICNYGSSSSQDNGIQLFSHDLTQQLDQGGYYRLMYYTPEIEYDVKNDLYIIADYGNTDYQTSRGKLVTVKISETGLMTIVQPVQSWQVFNLESTRVVLRCMYLSEDEDKLILGVSYSSSFSPVHRINGVDTYIFEMSLTDIAAGSAEIVPYTGGIGDAFKGPFFAGALIEKDLYRVTGTVRDVDNLPAERIVRAYRRRDGVMVATVNSDPATGDYELILPDAGPYDIQFMTLEGELLNDLFYARTEPEPL